MDCSHGKGTPRNLSPSRVSLSRRHTSILGEGKRLPNVPLDFSVLCLKDQKCAREKCPEITGFVTIDPGFGHRENKDLNRRFLTSLEVSLERLPAVCVAQHPHYPTVSQIVRHHCPLRQFANSVRPVRTMGKILIDPTKHNGGRPRGRIRSPSAFLITGLQCATNPRNSCLLPLFCYENRTHFISLPILCFLSPLL